jgi:AGZA family xanthine/uracil permease-like MFS transporter
MEISTMERLFKLSENKSSLKQELTAGLTTFAAMAYILAVNPVILSAGGMDKGAVVTATALASAVMTAVMALATNYPIGLAPGMGMNAFFAYTICINMKVPWQAALAMTFLSGFLFLILSVSGIRQKIIEAIPIELKLAISAGIGLFIAFIGLKNGGIIVSDPVTFVRIGRLSSPGCLMVLGGIILAAVLVWRRIHGAIILTVLGLTAIGLFVPGNEPGQTISTRPAALIAMPASLAPTFLKLDFSYVASNLAKCVPLILAILFVDIFDNMGTLIGVTSRAGLLDEKGNLPRIGRVLAADAGAAMVGSCLGTSTVTSYIESAAGVEEGGRTGLTALVVAGCFLLALFLHPLFLAIPPVATAPALVIVGIFMMQSTTKLDLGDFAKAVPAVLTMVLMPLSFSISEGLSIGFLAYVALRVGTGRGREVTLVGYLLALLFLFHVLWR